MVPVDGIFQAVGMYSDFSLVPVDAAESDVFAQAKSLSISLMEQQFQSQISGLDRLKAWKKSDPQAAAPFVCTSLVDGAYDSRLFTRRFVRTQTAQVWLELLLLRCGDTVTLEAAYQPDVLPAMVVEQILCTVVADMEQLVYPVNRAPEPAVNPCLPSLTDLLSEQFSTYRDHPFLLWSKGQLTYGQTDALANRLCQRLREAGLTSGSRVGILLSKSPLQAIASLAVRQSGGGVFAPGFGVPARNALRHRPSGRAVTDRDRTGFGGAGGVLWRALPDGGGSVAGRCALAGGGVSGVPVAAGGGAGHHQHLRHHRRAEIRRHPLCGGGQLPAGVPAAFFSDGQLTGASPSPTTATTWRSSTSTA